MIKYLLPALCILISSFSAAQDAQPVYKDYNWGDAPQITDSSAFEKEILKSVEIVEFIFEGDYFLEYTLSHNVELVNSDEQIEENNRKYVPFSESSELVEAKIRVIKPDGSVMVLDESKILSAVDEESGSNYRYFALEGLEPGSIIDYLHVVKSFPSYNGVRRFIQDEWPVREYRFELYAPDHLEFAFKVYNDTNSFVRDDKISDKNHWLLTVNNIEALKEEDSAPFYTLLKQLVYKFEKNNYSGAGNQTSFASASESIFNMVYPELDKKDEKALKTFLKDAEIPEGASVDEKIIAIENYAKDNINILQYSDPDYKKLSNIIKYKNATELGIISLLAYAYDAVDVSIEVLLTCDRTYMIFDDEFESYHYLNDYLFYFPETGKFIAPDRFEYRYDLIPWELTANKGLFVKKTVLGDFRTGIGKVKEIPVQGYDKSYHNINATAVIPGDFGAVELELEYISMGHYGVFIQPYYNLLDDEIKENFITDNFTQYFPEGEIESWSVENGEAKYVGKEPLIQHYSATTTDLIDKAGNKYLFKVGKLIGPQVEMYSETERTLPVSDSYKRAFDRELTIRIPEGYAIRNIDDLLVREAYVVDGVEQLLFESKYELDGNTLTVTIHEYYDRIAYSVDEFEDYRRVVNSAADFEKIVLVLEEE